MEFSSFCNARCPLCPRNLFGYPFNGGYIETNLSLALIKKSFSPQFISQLDKILVNGNFGDFTANLEALEILQYFKLHNNKLELEISTNGSARNLKFWSQLAQLNNVYVHFCLDGLEDTHDLYRQDTDFHKIIQNAKTYIDNGGQAIWKMIKFAHNLHQINDCERMSREIGFKRFEVIDHGRDTGPVFNRDGSLSHILGDWSGDTDIQKILNDKLDSSKIYNINQHVIGTTYNDCHTKKLNSIYISAEGKVYPCCYLAFNPQTYKLGYIGKLNHQVAAIVEKNSLHDYDLETCIGWFKKVESAWTRNSHEEGALITCDVTCGKVPQT